MPYRISCPGCQQPLEVPESALGRPAHCPHCRTTFDLPVPSPGAEPVPVLRRRPQGLPWQLVVPAYGLIMLGLAGFLVNGYLSFLFLVKPGTDQQFARSLIREIRVTSIMSQGRTQGENWEFTPLAASGGVAAALVAGEAEYERQSEELAAVWTPRIAPMHFLATLTSLIELLGGIAFVRGRYWLLALLGSLAAMANFNHLCCLPGAVVGIWGLLMLARDDVRPHFQREKG